jgi:ligand-binding sensor domain-containing protein/signal transduction histidine kinase
VVVAIAAWSIAAAAGASTRDSTASQYLRTRWEGEQGFPGGAVSAIAQTADGYLWIGTEKGLVRFDGVAFRLIERPSPGFAPITRVLGLATDAAGDLWVRLQGPRVVRYHSARFEEVVAPAVRTEAGFTAMSSGRTGDVLITGLRVGLIRQKGRDFTQLATAEDLPRSIVIAIAEAPGGTIWLGSRDAGLYSLNAGRLLAAGTGAPDRKINSLLAIDDRNVWIGTDNGLARWDGSAIVSTGVPSLEGVQALAMTRDRESNIWVGTSRGLVRVTQAGALLLDDRDPRSGQPITALFEDREGTLWVGDTRGVERFRASAFRTASAEGLPASNFGPVFIDSEHRTWFAPAAGGLYWMKNGRVERVLAKELSGDVVYSIAGRSGELWIGRQHGGLTRLREAEGSWVASTYTHAQGLAQDSVYAVYPSRDGAIWAATLSGGISRFKDGSFTTYTTAEGLLSNTVAAIAEGHDGVMWFATPNGLSALQQGRWRGYTVADGLPANDVSELFVGVKGFLWIGTANGLALLGSDGQILSRDIPFARGEPIFGIAQDRTGAIWIASADHVLRLDRDALIRGDTGPLTAREFGMADGLRSAETARRQRSLAVDGAGNVWISTSGGLSIADPARLTVAAAPAIIHIEAMSADGTPLNLAAAGAVRVPAQRQRVTFGFTGLSLAVPERVRYRYRLDNFDRDWSDPVTSREAVYTNLNPGEYYFRVMASNSDGMWNGKEAGIAFRIDPVFWQTVWFRLAVVGAVALGVLALYRIRVHQVSRQLSVRFEERLAERTRIAQELHDTLLQGFLSASMQLHVATDQLPPESPARAALGRVSALMAQVIEEGRNAVRGLRSPTSRAHDLAEAFSGIHDELGAGSNAEYRVIIEGQARPLNPIIRDEVYRIGREALVNAFRHSRASSIELELEYAAKQVRLLVRDNGVGIEPQVLTSGTDGHWGLSGMRERADRIGARLKVFSRIAAGTEVELTIPSAIAFRSARGEAELRER